MAVPAPRHGINLSWLLTLRWGALAGQLATILVVDRGMGIALPLAPLALLLAIGAASNVALGSWRRRADVQDGMLAAVMLLDIVLLTAVLYFTGGPFNPFSFLYLVNVALAAVILPPGWTWALAGMSLALFGGLFFAHVPLPIAEHGGHAGMDGMSHDHPISMHVQGMWVAFGVAAAFIVYFIQRVRGALAARDAELGEARSAAARHEKLASLATLAAGAAHELATPLSTIAVVAKELERALGAKGAADRPKGAADHSSGAERPHGANGAAPNDAESSTVADARLIREQVERCRAILVQMAADAGESAGEALATMPLTTLLANAAADLAGRARLTLAIAPELAAAAAVHVPPRALTQALRGVLKNALESSASGEVDVRLASQAGAWQLTVRDRGPGMAPEVLAHAGEPFFTTKNGDGLTRGMGLGLFLARVVLERVGGGLTLDSAPSRGTTATIVLPAADPATVCRVDAPGDPAMLASSSRTLPRP
ncbi:MAG: ATP-binding protein [Candidatus Binatia bacterium]